MAEDFESLMGDLVIEPTYTPQSNSMTPGFKTDDYDLFYLQPPGHPHLVGNVHMSLYPSNGVVNITIQVAYTPMTTDDIEERLTLVSIPILVTAVFKKDIGTCIKKGCIMEVSVQSLPDRQNTTKVTGRTSYTFAYPREISASVPGIQVETNDIKFAIWGFNSNLDGINRIHQYITSVQLQCRLRD